MGVRNSTHTLVKILQPFAPPGLRLVNYTHPPYRDSLTELFIDHPDAAAGGALLARGTEGEAVADTRRQVQVDWLHDGHSRNAACRPNARRPMRRQSTLPESRDAATTARWIDTVLRGEVPVPPAVARQVELIADVVRRPVNEPESADCVPIAADPSVDSISRRWHTVAPCASPNSPPSELPRAA